MPSNHYRVLNIAMLGVVAIKISLSSNEADTEFVYIQYEVAINAMKEASGVLGFVLEGIGVMKEDFQVV